MAQNQKHFRKRDAILDYLRQSKAHPSAETIYTDLKPQIPNLAMGTVYRNLTLFKQQGLVSSAATVSGVERFDANTDLHKMQVPESLSAAAAACCGGSVSGCQLSFTGLCQACKNLKESGESA